MIKQLLIIALLIFSINGYSQFSVASEYFPYNQKTDVHVVTSSPESGIPMIFVSGREVKVLYYSADFKLDKEIITKRTIKNSRLYLGSYIVDSNLVISFSDKKLTIISHLVIDLRTGESMEMPFIKVVSQKYIASWEVSDSLFVASIKENSNTIIIRKFFGKGDYAVGDFNFDSIVRDIDSSSNFVTLFNLFDTQEGRLQKIDHSIPASLKLASAKNKIYLVGEEVLITLDGANNTTYLLTLNIQNNTHSFEMYPYNALKDGQISAIGNSFIYHNTIFQLSSNSYELGVSIRDLDSPGKGVYYNVLKSDKIKFSNSGISERNEKEGFMFGSPVVREIRTTRKFLKELWKMKPAISVFSKYPDFQILIGGVVGIHQAAGVIASTRLSSGGEMIVSTSGNLFMPDPDYNIPTNYSFSSYSSRKSAYFSSVVDTKTFSHKNKSISKYTYDYIIEYANYMPGRYGLVTVFKIKNDYYLGYYKYSNKTYNIEWFKNIDDFSVQY
ncbi:MAG: hypothetical protein QM503_09630 [Bacteroidota bacterium]